MEMDCAFKQLENAGPNCSRFALNSSEFYNDLFAEITSNNHFKSSRYISCVNIENVFNIYLSLGKLVAKTLSHNPLTLSVRRIRRLLLYSMQSVPRKITSATTGITSPL